jgi:hypothetical protein
MSIYKSEIIITSIINFNCCVLQTPILISYSTLVTVCITMQEA